MRWPITAMAARCALGETLDEIALALAAGRRGLVPLGPESGLPVETWYGAAAAFGPAVDVGPPGRWASGGAHPLGLSALPDVDPSLPGVDPSLPGVDPSLPGVDPSLPGVDPLLPGGRTRQTALCVAGFLPLRDHVARAVARWGPDRVGVAIGTTTGGIGETERHHAAWRATGRFPDDMDARTWLTSRHDLHVTAATIAALAGARGPVVVQSSACASSAKVLATAARWLEHGVVDAVICGGVDSFCAYTVLGFHGLGILSSQPTRPFSAARDGINLGEAAALLVVERAGEPRVWLRGVGETSDAWHQTQPRPDGDGLAEAMRRALAQAGMRPEEVALVNAHATGTPANDAAEAAAMRAVLPHGPWVSATKAQTGHTLGAAGGLEAVLTALSLERGFVPPLCSAAPFDEGVAGFGLPHEVVRAPLKVGMSLSAAFAGHNAAVILEAP